MDARLGPSAWPLSWEDTASNRLSRSGAVFPTADRISLSTAISSRPLSSAASRSDSASSIARRLEPSVGRNAGHLTPVGRPDFPPPSLRGTPVRRDGAQQTGTARDGRGRRRNVCTGHCLWPGPAFVERFRRKARAAALNHPNTVAIFDSGSVAGTYYLAMEYVQGQTWRSSCAARACWCPAGLWRSPAGCARRLRPRMPRGWCTAISSPPMCW
jgi:hypothetical protein